MMTLIWAIRIVLARYLLGDGPQGSEYYVRGGQLLTRRQRAARGITEPFTLATDWSEVMDSAQ